MYALSRLRGVAIATITILGPLSLLSALAIATVGGRPGWLAQGDSTIEGGQEKVVGSRIVGALVRPRPLPTTDPGRPALGVLLGASAVGMAIDPQVLEAESSPRMPHHWLSLYANGANLADIRNLGELLLPSGLGNRLLVLGIHPGLLARSDDYLSDRRTIDLALLRRELNARHLITVKDELQALSAVPLNWAFPNRTRISNAVRGQVSALKRRLFARMGQGVTSLYGPNRDPWGVPLLIPDSAAPAHEAAAEGRTASVRDQPEGPMFDERNGQVKDKGWFNPDAYPPEGDNARALVALIREARDSQMEVAILLLPEASSLRTSVPPAAMQILRTVLDREFAANGPPVIDLRDALRDEEFHDSIHPNKVGRAIASRRLAEALRDRPEGGVRRPHQP